MTDTIGIFKLQRAQFPRGTNRVLAYNEDRSFIFEQDMPSRLIQKWFGDEQKVFVNAVGTRYLDHPPSVDIKSPAPWQNW